MINAKRYLRGQLAARAKDRGYENIKQGIYAIAHEEMAARIKPYLDIKIELMSTTLKFMVFTQDGHRLLNEYPPDITSAIAQCDQAIAEEYQRLNDDLNTSRY